MFSTTWLEFKDMVQDPLVRQEPVTASCNRQPVEGLETQNTVYTPRNIQPTVPYGGGSVMVWGCISHNCKLKLVTIQGNLTGDQYIRRRLATSCCPPFQQPPTSYKACVYG